MKRINVSLDDKVLNRIDTFSEKAGLNRSALITVATTQYIEAQEQLPDLQSQLEELKSTLAQLQVIK